MENRNGFTLVELMVVVAIIGLLASATILGFSQQQRQSRDARRIADISSLGIALESYRLVSGNYPGTSDDNIGEAVETVLTDLVTQGTINTLPRDPDAKGGTSICSGYRYASPTVWDSGRVWGLFFGAELYGGNATPVHPQNSSLAQSSAPFTCNGNAVRYLTRLVGNR